MVHNINAIKEAGGIAVRGVTGEGVAKPPVVTTDPHEAIPGADLILAVVPAFAQANFAQLVIPALEDGQTVVLSPGGVAGTLAFDQLLRASRPDLSVVLAETSTLVYAVKKDGPASVWIRGLKDGVSLATYPSRCRDEVLQLLSTAYAQFSGVSNVLESGLSNIANMIHPPTMVLNAGRIEDADEPWSFYYSGITPAVARTMQALDTERMHLLDALGLAGRPLTEMLVDFYGRQGMSGPDLYTLWHESPIHKAALAPQSLDARQLSEDIPYGLVPLVELASAVNVDTPVATSLVNLANTLNDTDYWASGRTLATLGLDGLDGSSILARASGEA
jgi:opine dehydrogenase